MTSSPSTPQPTNDKKANRLPLKQLFVTLFIQPQILMVLAHDKLRRAVSIVVCTGIVCGGLLGAVRAVPVREQILNWANWFEVHTQRLSLTADHRLEWARPGELPATLYNGRVRVDFMPDSASIETFEPALEDDRGVWISPTAVYWWIRGHDDDETIAQPIFSDGKIFKRIAVESLWPDGFEMTGDSYASSLSKWTALTLIPGVVVAEILGVLATTLFYTLVFAIVPYLLRSPLAARGFGGVYTFYLYASLPPLILATVYSVVAPQWMTFDNFFVTAFIVYLFFTMWKVRRAFQSK